MVRIARLRDHRDCLNDLARAYEREWPHWYGARGDAVADLNERAREHGLPLGLVALDDEKAVGIVALVAQGTASHVQLSPWAAGLWVEPSRRREGIGAKLLEAACAQARAEAHANVYASTANSARLFDRHGWKKIAVGTTFGGDSVDIFCKKL